MDTPRYDRAGLGVGTRVEGRAIVRQQDAITVILPCQAAEWDRHANLMIRPATKGS